MMTYVVRVLLVALCCCFSVKAEPTAAEYSQQLEQLARQIRHWNTLDSDPMLQPDYALLQRRFGQPMFFENLGFVEHVCRIDTAHGHCASAETNSHGDSLFIVTAPTRPYVLVLLSGAAPERTRLYRWDMTQHAVLLYDSHREQQAPCNTTSIEVPIRWVRQLRVQGQQLFIVDEDNAGVEPSRQLLFRISAEHCVLRVPTKA